MTDILYVHPHGQLADDSVVPVGAITCMNAVGGERAGVLSSNLEPDLLESAKVIALDLFWASAYRPFVRLLEHVRSCRPDLPIIVGGYSAASLAGTLARVHGLQHVVTGPSCEPQFRAIVAGHVGDVGSAGAPGRLDPVPGPWLRLDADADPTLYVHLTRSCGNPMGPCRRCCAERAPNARDRVLLYDADELRRFLDVDRGRVELWATGLPPEGLSWLMGVLREHPVDRSIDLLTCGALPDDLPAFIRERGTPACSLVHLVSWSIDDWLRLPAPERRRQRAILGDLQALSGSGVTLVRGNAADDEVERSLALDGERLEIASALNWDMPLVGGDDEESLANVDEFSAMATAALVARYFTPALFRHLRVAADPQLAWPAPLPGPAGAELDAALRRGHARWGTILPDRFDYATHLVRSATPDGPALDGSLRDWSSLTVLGREPATLEVTWSGWRVRSRVPTPRGDVGAGSFGVVVAPAGLETVLAAPEVAGVRVLPVPPALVGGPLEVDVTGFQLAWSGGGRLDVRAADDRTGPAYVRYLGGG